MRYLFIVILAAAFTGCHAPPPAVPDAGEPCDAQPPPPAPCPDAEAAYHVALGRLGGCPGYLYHDEWCHPAVCDEHTAEWWIDLWVTVPTCRDLYWSRGAYCGGTPLADGGAFPRDP